YHALALLMIVIVLLNACALGPGSAEPTAPPESPPGAASAVPGVTASPAALPESTPGADTTVTITFALHNYQRPFYDPLIPTFEEQNPNIHVQIVDLDTVITPVYDSTGLQVIDDERSTREILSAADTATFSVSPDAIAQGWVYDLTPLIEADSTFDRADFYPGVLEAASHDGHIYQLPSRLNVPLLAYNKDLWAARGLPAPDPNWSWSDVFAAAQQLVQKQGNTVQVYGLADWRFWDQALE